MLESRFIKRNGERKPESGPQYDPPPQGTSPVPQTQTPDEHDMPLPQVTPQPPQFEGSVLVSTHTPEQ